MCLPRNRNGGRKRKKTKKKDARNTVYVGVRIPKANNYRSSTHSVLDFALDS